MSNVTVTAKIPLDDADRKRLRDAEKEGLMSLFAILNSLDHVNNLLSDRITDKDAFRIRMSKGMLDKMLKEQIDTVPSKQLRSMSHDLDNTKLIRYQVNKPKHVDEDYRTLPMEDVLNLLNAAFTGCEFCTKNKQEQRCCKFAKSADAVLNINIETALPHCAYFAER